MLGPYRTPAPPAAEREAEPAPSGEDVMICVVVGACGLLRVALALASGEAFRVEATIALLMLAFAVVGLAIAWHRHRAR
jgi:hypothetical protein